MSFTQVTLTVASLLLRVIFVVCGEQFLDTFNLFLKIIYYLKCVVSVAGVEEHARHLMPKMKRHDLQQIHWR